MVRTARRLRLPVRKPRCNCRIGKDASRNCALLCHPLLLDKRGIGEQRPLSRKSQQLSVAILSLSYGRYFLTETLRLGISSV